MAYYIQENSRFGPEFYEVESSTASSMYEYLKYLRDGKYLRNGKFFD